MAAFKHAERQACRTHVTYSSFQALGAWTVHLLSALTSPDVLSLFLSSLSSSSPSLSLTKSCPGEGAGAAMPLVASEHAYIVSDIIPDLGIIPNLRCPDDSIYTKASDRSLAFFCPDFGFLHSRCKTTPSIWGLLRRTQGSGKPSLALLLAYSTSTWNPICPT